MRKTNLGGAVTVVFKTHLDIGFTDLAEKVVARYFSDFIPRAMALAESLRVRGGPERFVWTTGSWLIYEYLERAGSRDRKQMEQAILAGDIAWHALPFTTHTELMDGSLFRFGLGLSRQLDQRFGRKTIAAKMTDVPGHTRSIIPYLDEAGVRFLHIGVNPACPAPDVPPVFRWREPGGAEVMVMYGEGAYGNTHEVPGLKAHLIFAHSADNAGPPHEDEVVSVFAKLAERFPESRIKAGTMDVFARAVVKVSDRLPLVEQEIGDTWIHGVGTDPLKVARFRQLCRLRTEWEGKGIIRDDNKRYNEFSRRLLLVPEHTWGLDEKTHLPSAIKAPEVAFEKDATYAAAAFQRARRKPKFRALEASWSEQRAYVDEAVRAFGVSVLGSAARRALRDLLPKRPGRDGYTKLSNAPLAIETEHFSVRLDSRTGALVGLMDRGGQELAGPDHLLGSVVYQTFSEVDYRRFMGQYNINLEHRWCSEWAVPDFSKPGIDRAGALSEVFTPSVRWVGVHSGKLSETLLVEAVFPAAVCKRFGAPRLVTIEYRFPRAAATVEINLQWFAKKACRFPEALWFSFVPKGVLPGTWLLDKMGFPVSPCDVARNGNRNLHAVEEGVNVGLRGGQRLRIDSRDAALVSPGERRLLQFDNTLPALENGMHFNLYNNIWGTNFPMWYEDDARFRFAIGYSQERQQT